MAKKINNKKLAELLRFINEYAEHRRSVASMMSVFTWYDEVVLDLVEGINYEKERSDKMQKAISDFLKWENEEDRGISEGYEGYWIEQTERLAVAMEEKPEDKVEDEEKIGE